MKSGACGRVAAPCFRAAAAPDVRFRACPGCAVSGGARRRSAISALPRVAPAPPGHEAGPLSARCA
eukprot:2167107-Lingulodinium_polyedra.AAC.1